MSWWWLALLLVGAAPLSFGLGYLVGRVWVTRDPWDDGDGAP